MKKLSMTDWAFLQLETPNQLAHVAGLWIFQLPKGYRGDFFRDLREGLTNWQHVNPPFNYKLKTPIPKFDLPSWVEDEEFELDKHVHFARLPKPGTQAQLLEFVEQLHSQMLDRSRPLWDIHFIDGLQVGRVAIYCKIHHALVDGITGLNLMVNTFCQSAEASITRTLWQPPRKRLVENLPPGLLTKAGKTFVGLLGQLRSLPELSVSLVNAGLQAVNLRQSTVPLPFTAPKTLFNVPVSAQRRLAVHTLSLTAVKALSKVADATVNDVVLAVCAGALRRYLMAKQALPAQSLVAFMPVSMRSAQDVLAGGNQVFAVLCSLASEQADPSQRFTAIKASAKAAKFQFSKQSMETTNQHILLFGGLLLLIQQLGVSAHVAPPANVVVSNVPGPRQALYLNGAKLVAQYPLSMLVDGLALNITITSHADNLDFGILTCREALPDVDSLADYLGDAFVELQAAFTPSPAGDQSDQNQRFGGCD
ncbi:MAG: wax ester/triacylglycerol synthase family O-acyltransferase [Candidatus Competibacteraceae bacterium]|nr:wax ester/triacylglycerol synthase family O-acyltransferase [Candidatus Competibacteraceae bacterium]